MNKLEQLRASDNSEDAIDDLDLAYEPKNPNSAMDKFKEDYFTKYSDIKISIKEDW